MSAEKDKTPKVDQDGKMINPHNPDFITKVPWYLGNSGPTLQHHSLRKNSHELSLLETDALIAQKFHTKSQSLQKGTFRKGACKNCGAATHKEKDCLERPRSSAKAAWKSGIDIAPDEVVLNIENHGKLSYAGKRDHWKGYDATEYEEVIQRHNRLEMERKKIKDEQRQARISNSGNSDSINRDQGSDKESSASDSDSDNDSSDSDEEDDTKDFLAQDEKIRDFQGTMIPQGGIGGAGMRQTVRNLRLREDTPKYLRNLALDSAFYDPKSRSMRANPYGDANPEELPYAGDNFVRYSGDAAKLAQNQLLCWEMQARGENIDVLSNPSQVEYLQRQFAEKKQQLEESKRKELLDKYLDGKKNPQLDPRLLLGQTEAYIQYSKDGRVLQGPNSIHVVPRTKYEEDLFVNNHTSVWGSYFNRYKAMWGYSCCHSLLRNSYCTGEKGKEANNVPISSVSFKEKELSKESTINSDGKSSLKQGFLQKSLLFGESDQNIGSMLDPAKLKEAQKRISKGISAISNEEEFPGEGKKRGYDSMHSTEVTLEDMEAYRMAKSNRTEDPMANYVDTEND